MDLNEPEGLDANLPDFETWFFTGSEKRCPTQNFYGGDTQLGARSDWEGGKLRKACLLIPETTQLISGMFISMGVVTLDIPSNLQGDIRNPIQ